MNENMHAYNELELLATEQFEKHGVSLFNELPSEVQEWLIEQQVIVFKKWGVTIEDFPVDPDDPFIAAD